MNFYSKKTNFCIIKLTFSLKKEFIKHIPNNNKNNYHSFIGLRNCETSYLKIIFLYLRIKNKQVYDQFFSS